MDAAKVIIEVFAGVIPGEPITEFSRCWTWTSDQQERLKNGDPDARLEWIRMAGESREYAATLENPEQFNWVRRDWTWL